MAVNQWRGPRQQQGAAAVFAGISLIAILVAVGLAVDLGQLYFVQRDLMRMANMAALDAVRVSNGCLGPVNNAQATAHSEVLASVVRNGGGTELVSAVSVGRPRTLPGGIRIFETTPDDQAYAVEVVLARPLPPRLIPVFAAPADGMLTATAAAHGLPLAGVTVGSYGFEGNLASEETLLGPLLPGPLDIQLVHYNALFDAELAFEDLDIGVSVSEIREFLEQETPLPTLLNVIADALLAANESAAAAAVEAIAAASGAGQTVVPGDVFDFEEGFERPSRDAVFAARDVVRGVVQTAVENQPVEIFVPLPLGPDAGVTVTILEGLQLGFGPAGFNADNVPRTEARTAQVQVDPRIPLTLLGSDSQLAVNLRVFSGRARIDDIQCPSLDVPTSSVDVTARSGLVELEVEDIVIDGLTLNDVLVAAGLAPLPCLPLLPCPGEETVSVRIDFPAVGPVGSSSMPMTFFPPYGADNAQRVQSFPGSALAQLLADSASDIHVTIEPPGLVAGLGLLEPITEAVRAVLEPVLLSLDEEVFEPLLRALGISAGGADVYITEVKITQPTLFVR